ncbi:MULTISPECIES: SE1561 family protein [Sporosarcina]|uniref:SE1561 family protein n=1 Tax=Sporosarcina saromensis TaxID=359365 RepID=A0ABU4GE60_9BACL|nr:SE1561 family protein [Sporosarcina saromensis]MDW0114608.1 SE1561 family protein [Sporosarcina saromensis]
MEQRQSGQVDELKNRLHLFLEKLEAIEPENTDLQEIDQLISLIDELEQQMNKLKTDQ